MPRRYTLPPDLRRKKNRQDRRKEGEMTEREKREAAETDSQIEAWQMANSIGRALHDEQVRLGMVDTGYSKANWQVAHGRRAPRKIRGTKDKSSLRKDFLPLHAMRARIAQIAPYTVFNWIEYVPINDRGGKGGTQPRYAGFIDRAVRRGIEVYRRHRPKHLKDQRRKLPTINRTRGKPYG